MITEDQQVANFSISEGSIHLTYQLWWFVVTTAAKDSLSKSNQPIAKLVNTNSLLQSAAFRIFAAVMPADVAALRVE